MTTQAQLGIGSLLQYGDNSASPETFTTLAEALNLEYGTNREFIEVTNQDSPNNSREYIAGLIDVDEFSVECNLSGAGSGDAGHHPAHDAALGFYEDGSVRTWRVLETLSDGTSVRVWKFEALVAGYTVGLPVDGQKTITFTFRVTGGITRFNQ